MKLVLPRYLQMLREFVTNAGTHVTLEMTNSRAEYQSVCSVHYTTFLLL